MIQDKRSFLTCNFLLLQENMRQEFTELKTMVEEQLEKEKLKH